MGARLIVPGLFVLVGLSLVAAGVKSGFTASELANRGVTGVATVTEVTKQESKRSRYGEGTRRQTRYKSRVSFTDQSGRPQTAVIGGFREIGSQVEVIYLPERPAEARLKTHGGIWGPTFALTVIGAVFSLLGAVIFKLALNRQRDISWLRQSGTAVQAEVVAVQATRRRRRARGNTRSSYALQCRWLDPKSGVERLYTSDYRSRNYPSDVVGKRISVLIDPEKPDRYLVDLETLSA